jgi:hypothetical protein
MHQPSRDGASHRTLPLACTTVNRNRNLNISERLCDQVSLGALCAWLGKLFACSQAELAEGKTKDSLTEERSFMRAPFAIPRDRQRYDHSIDGREE